MRRGLTCCFGGSLLALIAAAIILFVGLPTLLQYLTRHDRQPLFDIQGLGQRYAVGAYDVILTTVTELPCGSDETCQQVAVIFEVVMHEAAADSGTSYSLSLQAGQKASDMITLSDGTALRVVAVQSHTAARADGQSYSVRFQALLPPD